LVGATPYHQQVGLIIGTIVSSIFIGFTVVLLHKTYVVGSPALPAPQANIMSFVIKGIVEGDLPWGLIFIGVSFGIIMEILGLPSLPLAVGIYLPLSSMATVFVGGCLRRLVERKEKDEEIKKENRERGILFASGFIAGEGLIMVIIAVILLSIQKRPDEIGFGYEYMKGWADIVALAIFALLAFTLYRSSFKKKNA
jgi:putative OPT family oligopeptide transporter